MKGKLLASALALLLLTGCGASVDSTPSATTAPSAQPSAEPTAQVTVHWDALSPQEDSAAQIRYFYDAPLSDLTPSDDYGLLVPYIGGEMEVYSPDYDGNADDDPDDVYHYTNFLYGLCTTDGRIVTDAVYTYIYQASWYDSGEDKNNTLPVWVLSRVEQDAEGNYYNAAALAAMDGSWYTGMSFRSESFDVSPDSFLMIESSQAAVLISAEDGSELARYSLDDFLSEDDEDAAGWFFTDGLVWGTRVYDDWFCYDPEWIGLSGEARWFDARTGEFLSEAPMEIPEYSYDPTHTTFLDGWYDPEENPLVLHYDNGTEESIEVPDGIGEVYGASDQFLLFRNDATNENILTDHQCKELARGEIWLNVDSFTSVQYPFQTDYMDENWTEIRYTILDPVAAQPLVVVQSYLDIFDGLMPAVDDTSYRLIDLANGAQDVLRIPRWSALDFSGDD
jgi:hypothetical protein